MNFDAPRSVALEIPSRLDCIEFIGESLRVLCPLAGFSEAESYRIELGVIEALNNVVEHAYEFQPDASVQVRLTFQPDQLLIEIRDEGKPRPGNLSNTFTFDSEVVDTWPEGGMGLFIMHEVMDRITYERTDGVNRLTLIKSIPW
ncbi:MAG: ATP-binding protein [Rhodothermales bacterium]|nr:ATP-binding protein [Rhodothermales bacterium]